MTNEGFTKIINFMTPGAGVLVLAKAMAKYTCKSFSEIFFLLNWLLRPMGLLFG